MYWFVGAVVGLGSDMLAVCAEVDLRLRVCVCESGDAEDSGLVVGIEKLSSERRTVRFGRESRYLKLLCALKCLG